MHERRGRPQREPVRRRRPPRQCVRSIDEQPRDPAMSGSPHWPPRSKRDRGSPTGRHLRAVGGRLHGICRRDPRSPTGRWRRGARGSTLWPCRLDQFGDSTSVTHERSVHFVDVRHSFGTMNAASAQGLLRQFTQEATPSRSATTCLDIYCPKQVIGQRNHHLGHVNSIPGDASSTSNDGRSLEGVPAATPAKSPRRPSRCGTVGVSVASCALTRFNRHFEVMPHLLIVPSKWDTG